MTATVIWITGIPAAGKTTLGLAVRDALQAAGQPARCLDGDVLRATVSQDLGFGRDARAENARRAATLAVTHVAGGEVAVVCLVSPFAADRLAARQVVQAAGATFLEVFVDTPVDECRRRDPKGLYAAAAAGRISALTGFDAPYEPPDRPEVHLRAADGAPALTPQEGVERVLDALAAVATRKGAAT